MNSDKITLRPLNANDVNAFLSWASDPEVTESLFWEPYQSVEEAKEFLKSIVEPHKWFMAICLNGVPVGAVTLEQGGGKSALRAELGYVIAKAHWGKGIATEAVRLALDRGFKDLNVLRIEAFVDPENHASIAVLEKSTLLREGHLEKYVIHRGRIRDRLVFAQTK